MSDITPTADSHSNPLLTVLSPHFGRSAASNQYSVHVGYENELDVWFAPYTKGEADRVCAEIPSIRVEGQPDAITCEVTRLWLLPDFDFRSIEPGKAYGLWGDPPDATFYAGFWNGETCRHILYGPFSDEDAFALVREIEDRKIVTYPPWRAMHVGTTRWQEGAHPLVQWATNPESEEPSVVDSLRARNGVLTNVRLRDGRILRVMNIAWGYDEGEEYAHVTTNISPAIEGFPIDAFSEADVVELLDPTPEG